MPTTGFFRDSKGNCHAQNNDRHTAADSASTKAHRTPAFRCWLCRSRLAPRITTIYCAGRRPRDLLRALSHQTPGLGPHVLDGQQAQRQPYWDEIISVLLEKFNEPKLERPLTIKIYR